MDDAPGAAAVKAGVFLALKKSADTLAWTAHVCEDGDYFEPTRPVVHEGVTAAQALSWLCASAQHAQARGAGVLGVGLVPSTSLGGVLLVVRDNSQSMGEPSDRMRAEMLPAHAPLVWMMAGATARIRLAPVTLFERAMPALGLEAALLLPGDDTAFKVWEGVHQLSGSLALPLTLARAMMPVPSPPPTRLDVGAFWFKLGAFSVYHYKHSATGDSLHTDLEIVPLLELKADGHTCQCVLPAPPDNHFRPFLLSYKKSDYDTDAGADGSSTSTSSSIVTTAQVVQEATTLLSHMCAGVAAYMDAPAHAAARECRAALYASGVARHVSFDDPRFPHARLHAELRKLLESGGASLTTTTASAVAAATDAASSAVDLTRLARGVLRAVAARVQAGKHKAEDEWRYAATASFDLLLMPPVAFEDVPPAWLPSAWNVTISDSVFTNALSVLLFRQALVGAVQAARECRFPGIVLPLEASMRVGVLVYSQQQQASSRAVALRRHAPDGTPVFFFDPTSLALGAPGLPPVHGAPVHLQVQPACDRNKVLGFFEAQATMLIAEEVAPLDARNAACAIAAMLVKRQGQQRLGHVYTELQAWMRDVRALTPAPSSSVLEKKRKRAG